MSEAELAYHLSSASCPPFLSVEKLSSLKWVAGAEEVGAAVLSNKNYLVSIVNRGETPQNQNYLMEGGPL